MRYYRRFSTNRLESPTPANDNNAPPGPRPLNMLTDLELSNLEANFVRLQQVASPHYTLHSVRLEKYRRRIGFNAVDVVSAILSLAAQSQDYLITYKELYSALWPTEVFRGKMSVRKIMAALAAAHYYCVVNKLPVVTTLVVLTNCRMLSHKAVINIYAASQLLGVNVGASAEDFVLKETVAAMDLVAETESRLAA